MATGFPTASVTIVDPGLPDAKVGVAYSYFLDAMDGDPPFTWALIGGALPPGLALNAGTGEISGTPTAVGTYNPEFEATDSLAKTGSRITPIRVVPDLGDVRRYQTEDALFNGSSVIPIEGALSADQRRKLARLLVRLDNSQIQQPYQLDARDLQVENFNAVPLQSVDDALIALLALTTGSARGLDNGTGLPNITPDGNDALNIVGVGSIAVSKNIGLNQMEISFVGAPLASPFDVMPAPSGDVTGATDHANLTAFFAGGIQDWVVSPQDESDPPYYINADLNPSGPGQLFRITGKSRRAFRIIGVGAVRTINQVHAIEHADLSDISCFGNTTTEMCDYRDVRARISLPGALVQTQNAARFRDCAIELLGAGAVISDEHTHFEADSTYFFSSVVDPAVFITPDPTGGVPAFTRISDSHFFFVDASQTGLDFSSLTTANKLVLLGINHYSGPGTAILRPAVTTVPNYAESPQLIDAAGVIPIPTF